MPTSFADSSRRRDSRIVTADGSREGARKQGGGIGGAGSVDVGGDGVLSTLCKLGDGVPPAGQALRFDEQPRSVHAVVGAECRRQPVMGTRELSGFVDSTRRDVRIEGVGVHQSKRGRGR